MVLVSTFTFILGTIPGCKISQIIVLLIIDRPSFARIPEGVRKRNCATLPPSCPCHWDCGYVRSILPDGSNDHELVLSLQKTLLSYSSLLSTASGSSVRLKSSVSSSRFFLLITTRISIILIASFTFTTSSFSSSIYQPHPIILDNPIDLFVRPANEPCWLLCHCAFHPRSCHLRHAGLYLFGKFQNPAMLIYFSQLLFFTSICLPNAGHWDYGEGRQNCPPGQGDEGDEDLQAGPLLCRTSIFDVHT